MKLNIEFRFRLTGHKDAVYVLLPSHNEGRFLSTGGDGSIVEWSYAEEGPGRMLARLPVAAYALQWAEPGKILLAGTRFGTLYILDIMAGKVLHQVDLKHDIFDLKLLPGNRVAAVTAEGHLHVLALDTVELLHSSRPAVKNGRSIALSPDGKLMATGWSDGQIRLYESTNFKELSAWEANKPSVFALHFNTAGDRLYSGGRDALLKQWEVSSGTEEKSLPAHWYTINTVIQSPDHKMLATGSRDKSFKIWDSETLDLLKVMDLSKSPEAHTHSVNALLWTEDDRFVSAGDDRKLNIWQITTEGE